MRRRALLAATGSSVVALGSGCLGWSGNDSSPPPKLGWVAVQNYDENPQRIRVRILREDDVVHDSTHEIEGRDEVIPGDVLECTWGDRRGPYTFRARVEGGEWVEMTVEEAVEEDPGMERPDCVVASVQYKMGTSDSFTFRIRDTCEAVDTFDGGCSFANSM